MSAQGTSFSNAALGALIADPAPVHSLRAWVPGSDSQPASVLIPLLRTPAELRVLLTRRSDGLSNHAGQFAFPGGRPEPADRDAAHTALREAEEEVGLPAALVELLGELPPTSTYRTNFAIRPFVGVIDTNVAWVPQHTEVAELIEPTLAELAAVRELHEFEYDGQAFTLPTFQLSDQHVIWGATARILDELLQRLMPLLRR